MRPRSATLTPHELEIMKVVWPLGRATVRDVYEQMRARRPVAYTTVMTMMKIVERKGYLRRVRQGRAFVYRPAQPRTRVVRRMIRDFLDRVFDGSAEPLLVQLVNTRRIREGDLERLAELIRKSS